MAIDPKLLRLNSFYSRAELGDIFGDEKIASSREGLYPDGDRVIFFVTLDKEDRDQTVSYEDYFADGLFYWQSQSTQAPHHKNIREILSTEMEWPLVFRVLVGFILLDPTTIEKICCRRFLFALAHPKSLNLQTVLLLKQR